MNKLSCQCWSCGLCCPNGEELAYHLLANSTCAYEYRADGCLHPSGFYLGTAHVRLCRKSGQTIPAMRPWLVEVLQVKPLKVDWVNRFPYRPEAERLVKVLNNTALLPLRRYCQTTGRVG